MSHRSRAPWLAPAAEVCISLCLSFPPSFSLREGEDPPWELSAGLCTTTGLSAGLCLRGSWAGAAVGEQQGSGSPGWVCSSQGESYGIESCSSLLLSWIKVP